MTWVLVAIWVSLGCIAVAMLTSIVDEVRLSPSNIRRSGVGLALVFSFVSLWCLSTPVTSSTGLHCGAPVMVIAAVAGEPIGVAEGCLDQLRLNAIIGVLSALACPIAVASTRGRQE
jgi:hypothetical protein